MSLDTDALASVVAATLRAVPGVVQLYPPAGNVPVLAGALNAVRTITGSEPAEVAVTANADGIESVRAAIGIDRAVAAPVLVRQLCAAVRQVLADDAGASEMHITITIARLSS